MSTTDYKSLLENRNNQGNKEQDSADNAPLNSAPPLRSPDQPLIDRSYDYKMDNKVEFKAPPSAKSVLHKVIIMIAMVVAFCVMSKFFL